MNYELMTQKELLELILDAEKKYYETGEKTISDAVYDKLLELADPTIPPDKRKAHHGPIKRLKKINAD